MSEKVKNEHYVPQRYLRAFANGEKFFVYDKEKAQKRSGNIGDYASERYFYDVDFEELKKEVLEHNPDFRMEPEIENLMAEVDEQHIEHWFGQNVETWLFEPISKVITTYTMANAESLGKMQILSDDNMDYLSLYLAIQLVRSKEFREQITELYERVPLLLADKFMKNDDVTKPSQLFNVQLNKNHKKLFHAQFLMDQDFITEIAISMRNKIWLIGYNQTAEPFITSDNPVVRYSPSGRIGLNTDSAEIIFPISSNLILILGDMTKYESLLSVHNHFIEMSKDEVKFYNSIQLTQSYRYVFCKEDKFENIDKLLKENKQLMNIKHQRFLMG